VHKGSKRCIFTRPIPRNRECVGKTMPTLLTIATPNQLHTTIIIMDYVIHVCRRWSSELLCEEVEVGLQLIL
jgi:hypothetical protein